MLFIVLAVTLGLLATPAAASETQVDEPARPTATGASVPDLPAHAVVLRVDASTVITTVWPDGSDAHPFPTIEWAVAHSKAIRKQGRAVHVLVAPGDYREMLNVSYAGDNPAPLVIESAVPGAATISGADVEARWTPVAGTNLFDAPWKADWGLTPIPNGWGGVKVPDGIRRREAVLVDGKPLVQVLTEAELAPNTFYVDEVNDRIRMYPPAGVADPTEHLVEVAVRERAMHVKGRSKDVTVKGFVFEAAATPLPAQMVYVSDASDIVIEDNTFRYSSWGGLGICCTTGVTVRGNRAVDNGGNGIDTFKTTNAVIEDNVLTGNNFRGASHGFVGWSVAGSKNLHLADAVFRNNTYTGNYSRGLWLDTDVQNVLVTGDRACNNGVDGLFIEATQGPVTIEDSTYCDNGGAGILVGTSGNVTVQRTTMSDNRYGQLVFSGDRSRQWADRLTGGLVEMGDFENWTLRDNTFTATGKQRLIYSPVIPIDEWRQLLTDGDIQASGNTWKRLSMDGAIRIRNRDFSMEEWRKLTGDTDR